jgi:hypothetical protein
VAGFLLGNPGNGVVAEFGVLLAYLPELFVLGGVQPCLYLLEVVEHEYGHPGFRRFAHKCCRVSRRQVAAAIGFDHFASARGILFGIARRVTDVVLGDEIDRWLGLRVKALNCERSNRNVFMIPPPARRSYSPRHLMKEAAH